MAVHHRLPGRRTGIEPDVVPRRREILLNHVFTGNDQRHHGRPLLNRHRKEIRRMAERDDQQVAAADREPVPEGIAQFVAGCDILRYRVAERASHRRHAPDPRDDSIRK